MSCTVTIELRKAERRDVTNGSEINRNLVFWVKSAYTGEFDGPYTVSGHLAISDVHAERWLLDFKKWFLEGMIWIRKTEFDK